MSSCCDGLWRVLWGVWKWLVHCVIGHCEVYRICKASSPIPVKTAALVQSLRYSKTMALRGVAEDLGTKVDVAMAMLTIMEVKQLKEDERCVMKSQLEVCLVRQSGVKQLWQHVEDLRAVKYSQEDHTHEDLLMKLWENLQPGVTRTNRITLQWQDIGFQGNNPATDFRGMGLLGLHFLLYFSEHHQDISRSVLQHSKHPKFWYPFAVTGIDISGVLYNWLKTGTLDQYLMCTCAQWPPPTSVFHDIACYMLCRFDKFWLSKEPENIMAFPRVKQQFLQELKSELDTGQLVMTLKPLAT